ncbi:MAG TPA: hypothetical protein VHE35_05175 [Kofleriaceae bacterium]|nr:hypothetical protein [Kofleriaceae bacterium]
MSKDDGVTKVVANVRVGKAEVSPTAPSHVRGVSQGNAGHGAAGDARRSTGIRPEDHDVIDPRMPRISPA